MTTSLFTQKKLERYCKYKEIWDYKNKRPNGFVINKVKDFTAKHPNGQKYKISKFNEFTTKQIRFKYCLCCHSELKEKQKKYCDRKCCDSLAKARKKALEQGGETITVLKEPDFIFKWHKVQVIFRDEKGRLYTKPLTNKKGKTKLTS